MSDSSKKTVTVVQTGSPIGRRSDQEATLIGLGLNKRHRQRTLEDTPAVRGMIRVPLREGRTLHHDIADSYGAGKVVIRAAKPGTGIIAGGPMRAIFEALGVQDIVAKSVGTSNPHNMIKATFAALTHVTSPRAVAARRGKKVAEILGRPQSEARENA